MKAVIIFVGLFAVAAYAVPISPVKDHVEIVKQESDVGPESFHAYLEQTDGTKIFEDGILRDVGSDHESLAVRGSFTFVADDHKTYTVNYIADENGFQPHGDHLPDIPA